MGGCRGLVAAVTAVILVDSTVWAAFFNGEDTAEVLFLDRLLSEADQEIVTVNLVVAEVLQGFRTEKGFRTAERLMRRLPLLEPDTAVHVDAARLFRRLRKKGITIRGAVDCIIAQTCIEFDAGLLAADRDFLYIAEHSELSLVAPEGVPGPTV